MSHSLSRLAPLGLTALALALTAAAPSQAASPRTASAFEARFRAVEDYQAIQKLLVDYMGFMETRSWIAYANAFSRDGELLFQSNHYKGQADIMKLMAGRPQGVPPGTPVTSRNALTNIDIELTGDTATSVARFTTMTKGEKDERPTLTAVGYYADTFVREGGQWKLRRRVVYNDFPFNDPVANVAKAAAAAR